MSGREHGCIGAGRAAPCLPGRLGGGGGPLFSGLCVGSSVGSGKSTTCSDFGAMLREERGSEGRKQGATCGGV